MTKKVLLVGANETKLPLRAISKELRARGVSVSAYFDADVASAIADLPSATFLLIGLSRAGREISSAEHRQERALLEYAAAMPTPLPCAVLRDTDGYISAPYLTVYGHLIRLVFSDAHDGQPAPLMLFQKFSHLWIRDAVGQADVVAGEIQEYLESTSRCARV